MDKLHEFERWLIEEIREMKEGYKADKKQFPRDGECLAADLAILRTLDRCLERLTEMMIGIE